MLLGRRRRCAAVSQGAYRVKRAMRRSWQRLLVIFASDMQGVTVEMMVAGKGNPG